MTAPDPTPAEQAAAKLPPLTDAQVQRVAALLALAEKRPTPLENPVVRR